MANKISKSEVVELLLLERYDEAAKLGEGALRHLKALVSNEDKERALAEKAVYTASLIGGKKASEIVYMGSMSRKPFLRVTAASAAKNLDTADAEPILLRLVNSKDVGIRKLAIRSIQNFATEKLKKKLKSVCDSEKVEPLRKEAASILRKLGK